MITIAVAELVFLLKLLLVLGLGILLPALMLGVIAANRGAR